LTTIRSDWQGKLALITGASTGIGAATARILARRGLQLVLVARRKNLLEGLAQEIRQTGSQAFVRQADLAQEANRMAIVQDIRDNFGEIDVLINSAGLGWYGYYADMPYETISEMLQVNIATTIHLTRQVLPSMLERNAGHIIHIGSIVGSFPSQGVTLYSASKSFLDAFNTSLYRELQGTHIHTSIVRAGPVKTEFFRTAANRPEGRAIPVEGWGINAEVVARRVDWLLHHPRRQVFVPRWLAIVPWIELIFGWVPDRLGPLLLKRFPY